MGYYLSNRRTLICRVIGNDEKTYNLCDKTWKFIVKGLNTFVAHVQALFKWRQRWRIACSIRNRVPWADSRRRERFRQELCTTGNVSQARGVANIVSGHITNITWILLCAVIESGIFDVDVVLSLKLVIQYPSYEYL